MLGVGICFVMKYLNLRKNVYYERRCWNNFGIFQGIIWKSCILVIAMEFCVDASPVGIKVS